MTAIKGGEFLIKNQEANDMSYKLVHQTSNMLLEDINESLEF